MSSLLLVAPLLPSQPPPPDPLEQALAGFWTDMAAATIYKTWKKHNPGELSRLAAYAAGGSRPVMLTAFGKALVRVVDAARAAGLPNPEIP